MANENDFTDLVAFNAAMAGTPDTYLAGALASIRKYCGWHIAPGKVEEIVLDGSGGTHLDLPTLHLNSLISVFNDGVPVDLNDVDVSKDGTLELHNATWSTRLGGIRITINHGFDDAHELSSLVYAIAGRAMASPQGQTEEQVGEVRSKLSMFGRSSSGGISLMSHEYALVDPYRLPKGF